jgi:nucleoside-diphosphate-sugar epimerase
MDGVHERIKQALIVADGQQPIIKLLGYSHLGQWPPPARSLHQTEDGFLTTVLKLLRRLPVYPMFGGGSTRLQPVYVEDVAEAITMTLRSPHTKADTYEFGGPRVYTYAEFLRSVAHEAGRANTGRSSLET